MQEESKGNKYIIINNFKVFVGLPIKCKKTMTINKTIDLKNNEEFEVIFVDDKNIKIKNDRLQAVKTHQHFKHFDYHIVSQPILRRVPRMMSHIVYTSINILINLYYILVCQEVLKNHISI